MEEYLGSTINGITVRSMAESGVQTEDQVNHAEVGISVDDSSVVFDPFRDHIKRRFLWYYDSYLQTIAKAKPHSPDGKSFMRMPFENGGHSMDGRFGYTELERRLIVIKKALDAETAAWAQEGVLSKQTDSGVAANLQRQFEQVVESYRRDQSVTLDIKLEDDNPFVWSLTYFGRPMTNLDGGLFRLKVFFSPRFPDEQPRVRFETSLFHHRIAADGTPCYIPKRAEDVKCHIEAIITALEEESPPYDPRTLVNPEASKLFWGSAEDKKMYNRKLRRAVQRSMEWVFPNSAALLYVIVRPID